MLTLESSSPFSSSIRQIHKNSNTNLGSDFKLDRRFRVFFLLPKDSNLLFCRLVRNLNCYLHNFVASLSQMPCAHACSLVPKSITQKSLSQCLERLDFSGDEPLDICLKCFSIDDVSHFNTRHSMSLQMRPTSCSIICHLCHDSVSLNEPIEDDDSAAIVALRKVVNHLRKIGSATSLSAAFEFMQPAPSEETKDLVDQFAKVAPLSSASSSSSSSTASSTPASTSILSLCGFHNLGNTCFFNAVLQNLCELRPLRQLVHSLSRSEQVCLVQCDANSALRLCRNFLDGQLSFAQLCEEIAQHSSSMGLPSKTLLSLSQISDQHQINCCTAAHVSTSSSKKSAKKSSQSKSVSMSPSALLDSISEVFPFYSARHQVCCDF